METIDQLSFSNNYGRGNLVLFIPRLYKYIKLLANRGSTENPYEHRDLQKLLISETRESRKG